MSRIVVYDENNFPVGEFTGIVSNLGWSIGLLGGSATVSIPDTAIKDYIQFGRIVTIETPNLPAWAGVLDTPWVATSPVQLTMYNIEYLLNTRVFDEKPYTLKAEEPAEAISELITLANKRGNLYVKIGDKSILGKKIAWALDARTYLDQIKQISTNAGMELLVRTEKDVNNQLWVYVDAVKSTGETSNLFLHDGLNANIELKDAKVDGEIFNYIVCRNDSSTTQAVILSDPAQDAASIDMYGLRNAIITSNTSIKTALNAAAIVYLSNNKNPKLILTVSVMNIGDAFNYLRLGNTFDIHLANVRLPGAVNGWHGTGRIKAMEYNESSNQVDLSIEAQL
jgi:hypothetical protein